MTIPVTLIVFFGGLSLAHVVLRQRRTGIYVEAGRADF
jgi:hypothetical protein